MEPELITSQLDEFNAGCFVINTEDSDTHLYFLVLSALILGHHVELDLEFISVDFKLNADLLEVLADSLLDHIWIISREKLSVGGEQPLVIVDLLGKRNVLDLVIFNLGTA